MPSDPGNFAKSVHVELFELLDVPPVQGPALGAEQGGCEDRLPPLFSRIYHVRATVGAGALQLRSATTASSSA